MRRALALLALGLGLAGCGLGAGEQQPGGVELRVTRDFGERLIGSTSRDGVRPGDTVMRLLRSSQREVETRYGGRFVQSIGGLSGRGPEGRRDWFFFVNGIESETGAAEYGLRDGDRIQWDYRNWSATMSVPAIVGAFPEPLVRGVKGKRFPVRVECEDEGGAPCREVKRRLRDAGVKTNSSSFGADATRNILRVIVARWARARTVQAVGRLTGKPDETGVFARFEGDRLRLLGADGETVPGYRVRAGEWVLLAGYGMAQIEGTSANLMSGETKITLGRPNRATLSGVLTSLVELNVAVRSGADPLTRRRIGR